jgi:hypothetical protein
MEVKAFKVFQRGGFPQLKPPGVLAGRNQREFDAGGKPENAVAGDFENALANLKNIVFLPAANKAGDNDLGI